MLFGAPLVLLCIECFALQVTYLEMEDVISRLLRSAWPIYILDNGCAYIHTFNTKLLKS